VIAKVSANGRVAIHADKAIDILFDLEGWYASATGSEAAAFTAVTPARLVDTRTSTQVGDCPDTAHPSAQIPAGGTISVPAAGKAGVPATGATAVAVNITAFAPAASGYLRAAPSGTAPPMRTLSFTAGQNDSAATTVRLGSDGRISIFANQAVDVAIDIAGYYQDADTTTPGGGTVYQPVAATHLADTVAHTAGVCTADPCTRTTDGSTTLMTILGKASVPNDGTVTAVVVDITGLNSSATGLIEAYPSGEPRPGGRTSV
jgi:hypothetical protein